MPINDTKLKLVNSTSNNIVAYITLGVPPGAVVNVNDLVFTDDTNKNIKSQLGFIQVTGNILQCSIILKATGFSPNYTFIAAPNQGQILDGNITFGTPPINCPTTNFPHGVNLAEFIINNGNQQGSPQETVDISGVAGANSIINYELPGGDWTANNDNIAVSSIENKDWDQNTGIPGVFPYSCDNCTATVRPPACVGHHPQFCNELPICNVQRFAKSNAGGTIVISYKGATTGSSNPGTRTNSCGCMI